MAQMFFGEPNIDQACVRVSMCMPVPVSVFESGQPTKHVKRGKCPFAQRLGLGLAYDTSLGSFTRLTQAYKWLQFDDTYTANKPTRVETSLR
jgi:hypothetical protein